MNCGNVRMANCKLFSWQKAKAQIAFILALSL